jgi:hypothetical protein
MIELDDDRLAEVLASVGALLVTVPDITLDPAVVRTPARTRQRSTPSPRWRWRWRWQWAPALAAVLIAAVVLTVAPVRSAVAGWLGIGSTSIQIDPTPPSTVAALPSIDAGLRRIDRASAAAQLGSLPVGLDATTLGPPAGFATMPEGGVLVVWADATTLWIHDADVEAGMLFDKLVQSGQSVQSVDELGDQALVISGDHFLRTPHRMIAATTSVLWQSDDREYRLESDRDGAELIALARQIAAGS